MRKKWKCLDWVRSVGCGLCCSIALSATSAQAQSVRADFNGDGREDLAIGVPNEAIGNKQAAGAVHVLYGATAGVSATGSQFWSQDGTAVKDSPDDFDHFGAALAAGDFNGDGFADLAIGVPGEDEGLDTDCGAVHILFGSSSGLRGLVDEFWTQGSTGVKGFRQDSDMFGSALAAGDFNGDGFSDLAIGVPLEDSVIFDATPGFETTNTGAVNVLFGSNRGLDVVSIFGDEQNDEFLQERGSLVEGTNENFGAALATGDFNRDGFDDLAVGVPGNNVRFGAFNRVQCGSVMFWFGSERGFSPGDVFNTQDFKLDGPEVSGARFGASVVFGDFDGDLFDDVAIGAPFDIIGTTANRCGRLYILPTDGQGIMRPIDQNSPGIPSTAQNGDEFASALATGDFNGDGFVDLAVGVPGEDISGLNNAGSINVIYGGTTGLSTANEFHENSFVTVGVTTFSISDTSEANDQFGRALFSADFNNDGRDDLAIGVPGENSGAGSLHLFRGGGVGLSVLNGNQYWTQNSAGIAGGSEAGDNFASGLPLSPKQGPGGPGFSGIWEYAGVDLQSRRGQIDSRVVAKLMVFNPGGEIASRSVVEVYLSADDVFSSDDRLILVERRFAALDPGESRSITIRETVRDLDATGLRVIAKLDATNVVAEANEDNNIVVSDPLDTILGRVWKWIRDQVNPF